MGAAELGNRVVPVVEEDTLVEVLRPPHVDEWVVVAQVLGDVADAGLGIGHELVEEEPAYRLVGAAVSGEEGALDDLRQVDQGEDGPVDVGEEPEEDGLLIRREGFPVVVHRASIGRSEQGAARVEPDLGGGRSNLHLQWIFDS